MFNSVSAFVTQELCACVCEWVEGAGNGTDLRNHNIPFKVWNGSNFWEAGSCLFSSNTFPFPGTARSKLSGERIPLEESIFSLHLFSIPMIIDLRMCPTLMSNCTLQQNAWGSACYNARIQVLLTVLFVYILLQGHMLHSIATTVCHSVSQGQSGVPTGGSGGCYKCMLQIAV